MNEYLVGLKARKDYFVLRVLADDPSEAANIAAKAWGYEPKMVAELPGPPVDRIYEDYKASATASKAWTVKSTTKYEVIQ